MNRREFITVAILTPVVLPAQSDDSRMYRARVLYPTNDKYKFHAIQRSFNSILDARGWTARYSRHPRVVTDVKNLVFPEKSSLLEWANWHRPEECPPHLFRVST